MLEIVLDAFWREDLADHGCTVFCSAGCVDGRVVLEAKAVSCSNVGFVTAMNNDVEEVADGAMEEVVVVEVVRSPKLFNPSTPITSQSRT